jgi:hypothetical protein
MNPESDDRDRLDHRASASRRERWIAGVVIIAGTVIVLWVAMRDPLGLLYGLFRSGSDGP